MKELIDSTIAKIFAEKLQEKYTNFKENSTLAHYQSRRDFFLKMKYFVFNRNFLYNPLDEQKISSLAKNLSLPLFFPENPTESFLDVPNPELSPSKFPAAKASQLIKKASINDDFTVYKVSDDKEIGKLIKENQETFKKAKNQRDLYFKPSPEAYLMREKQFEFNMKYNLGTRERDFREKYIQSVMMQAKKSRRLKKYILDHFKGTDPNEIFFDDQQANYKEVVSEFLGEMRLREAISVSVPGNEEEMKKMQEKINKIREINGKLTKEYDGHRVDLQLEGNLRFSTFKKLNEKNLMEQVLNYLESDKEMKALFDPLVTKLNGSYGDELRDRYLKLFLQIYSRHAQEILVKEFNEFKSAAPVLTRDGKTPFLNEEKEKFMEFFDDYIQRQVGVDFNKIIMDDVLYIFSFFTLIEMEKRLNFFERLVDKCESLYTPPALNDGKPFYTRRFEEYEERIIKIYKMNEVNINKFEELEELTEFLSSLCENLGGMYAITRNKVKFPQSRLYKAYQEKVNENYREHFGFNEKIAAHFELKHDLERNLRRLDEEKGSVNITRDNSKEFNLSAKNVEKWVEAHDNGNLHAAIENDVPADEQKIMGKGLINYLRKLEGLTARGINGKFNVLLFRSFWVFLIWISFCRMNSIFQKKSIVFRIISDSETPDNQLGNGLKKRFFFIFF